MSAIQTIEQELGTFFKQREQAIANVHAVDGAIQAAQHLLIKLRAEEAKVVGAVEAEVTKVVDAVEGKVEADVKTAVVEVAPAVEAEIKKI